MVVLLIVLNAAVSPSAHADTYLCIGEHYASVTYTKTETIGSDAGTNSDKELGPEFWTT